MRNFALFFFILILVPPSFAQRKSGGGHSGVKRKQEAKIQARWSLAEWMEQKGKMGLQDRWLAINTSDNPYEFWLQGERSEQKHESSLLPDVIEKYNFFRARAGAYASIVGFEGGHEFENRGWSSWDASFNLRILGTAYQNTNLTLKGGAKGYQFEDPVTKRTEYWQLPFAGVHLTLYFNKFFGVSGEHWLLFSEQSAQNTRLRAENSRALAFIDFYMVRVYGGWNREFLLFADEQLNRRTETRDGFMGGLQIFF